MVFPWLLFVVVAVEVHQTFFRSAGEINAHIYNIQVPIQHILYLFILYLASDHVKIKRFLVVAIIIYIIATVASTPYYSHKLQWNVISYSTGSILISIGILLKFYEMLESPEQLDFLKNPFFYLLFAYLFFCVGTLPYFAMGNWLYFVKGEVELVRILANVKNVLNYILYGTYTAVFIWMRIGKAYY